MSDPEADTYGEIQIEELNLSADKSAMTRRAFCSSVSEVELGAFQTTLTYQTEPDRVSVVDRPLRSSQIHHGGFGTPTGARLAKRRLCQHCFSEVDRDKNTGKDTRYSSVMGPWQLETSPPRSFPGRFTQAAFQMAR